MYEQNLVCLQTLGMDQPWSLDSYRQCGGYEAWENVLAGRISVAEILQTI